MIIKVKEPGAIHYTAAWFWPASVLALAARLSASAGSALGQCCSQARRQRSTKAKG